MFLTVYFIGIILCFARLSGFFIPLPVYGSKNIPSSIKIGLIFFITYSLIPILDLSYIQNVDSFLSLAGLIVLEFLKGTFLGLSFVVALNCIYLLGSLIDRNIGFSMVSIVNPMGTQQLPISANFFYIIAMMLFFIIDGHHQLIRVFVQSYEYAPLGMKFLNIHGVWELILILQKTFVLGFQLASPFIITIIVANIILGLLAKSMPGMNVFMIGMPFKVFVGMFLFIILSPVYIKSLIEVFLWIWENFMRMFIYLG